MVVDAIGADSELSNEADEKLQEKYGVSIAMPGEFSREQMTMDRPEGGQEIIDVMKVEDDGISYNLNLIQYPPGFMEPDPDQFLLDTATGLLLGTSTTNKQSEPITKQGLEGIEFECDFGPSRTSPEAVNGRVRQQLLRHGDLLVWVYAIVPDSVREVDSERAEGALEAYFQSLRIDPPAAN